MVHIVQSNKKTTSYGTGKESGNVYYKWPSWFPVIGVTRIIFPVNNFNINLDSYEAYDKDRLPFILDVTAFFRIAQILIKLLKEFQVLMNFINNLRLLFKEQLVRS